MMYIYFVSVSVTVSENEEISGKWLFRTTDRGKAKKRGKSMQRKTRESDDVSSNVEFCNFLPQILGIDSVKNKLQEQATQKRLTAVAT